jgi:predicted dienelactone hydrolase
MRRATAAALLTLVGLVSWGQPPLHADYDPLKLEAYSPTHHDLTVQDQARNRDIPIRVYLPKSKEPAPVILYSHGLGGSRTNNAFLAKHWTARGYVAVFLQHPGSDESVWKEAKLGDRLAAMRQAASGENLILRLKDVPAVLDQLEVWNRQPDHPLAGRLDLKRIGMSGHSFGAQTTQGVSGQTFPLGKSFTDPRIKAALAFSPSPPKVGDVKKAFGQVKIPWMLMTGTKDDAMSIVDTPPADRLKVFPALPPGSKYELVLDEADHLAFGEARINLGKQPRNPNHHRAILALSTAFWDAYLRDDRAARDWLDGDGPRRILEPKDSWKKK